MWRRHSRRREALERWRSSAIDAYAAAGLIDDLALAGSPDVHRRIADSSATFHALSRSGPDLPSAQAAYIVACALSDLETALQGADETTLSHARYRLHHALAVFRPLLADVAPAPLYGP